MLEYILTICQIPVEVFTPLFVTGPIDHLMKNVGESRVTYEHCHRLIHVWLPDNTGPNLSWYHGRTLQILSRVPTRHRRSRVPCTKCYV